jgi:hypothetical protein
MDLDDEGLIVVLDDDRPRSDPDGERGFFADFPDHTYGWILLWLALSARQLPKQRERAVRLSLRDEKGISQPYESDSDFSAVNTHRKGLGGLAPA